MGITEILTIIFVVLKLIGKIDWSWWLVLLPEILAAVWCVVVFIAAAHTGHRAIRHAERSFRDFDERW